ncbi:unnamed protein product [Phytophthora fragariaefolia]|uniref:Unnamed protein product n=1 Tax=Phytophthora fragariaefolia TaxID=1490495 RepID=A0A9W6Y363_9STRA|nr:unnamed protein product [Phytophthora fragariaefolia]
MGCLFSANRAPSEALTVEFDPKRAGAEHGGGGARGRLQRVVPRHSVAAVLPAERADGDALLRAVAVLRPLVQQRAPQDAAPGPGPAQEPARRRVRAAAQRGQAAAAAALHHPQAAAQRPHAGGAAGHLLRAGRHRVPGAQHPCHAHLAPCTAAAGRKLELASSSLTRATVPCVLAFNTEKMQLQGQ